ncbi:MAG: hypothetical protein H2174_04620 [Vampirovibrio sp.]|nr:hypothetical protein [Vampirovibrio sp.]
MPVPVTLNFKRDLREFIVAQLDETCLNSQLNIYPEKNQLTKLQEAQDIPVLLSYVNWRNRLFLGRKRLVILSKELYNNAFYSRYKKEIQNLKLIFESGGNNIRPFLSTKVNDLLYNDGLLRDWGLHHIHFVPAITPKKRTNEILFIMERPDSIYFIDIFSHDDWVNLRSLEIIHRNWPETIEQFILKGITPDIFTDEALKTLRKKNVSYTIGLDGNAYAPTLNPNSKLSTVIKTSHLLAFIEELEQVILHDIHNIQQQIQCKTNTTLTELNFELVFFPKEKKVLVNDKILDRTIDFGKNLTDLNQLLINLNVF